MWKNESEPIDFAARRKKFLHQLEKCSGVAFFASPPEMLRNTDVHHPYRQDSNFYYLTGFEEPESYAIFNPASPTPFQLFVRPRDKEKEMWDGKILGPQAAEKIFGADAGHPSIPDLPLDEALCAAIGTAEVFYYRVNVNSKMDRRVFSVLQKGLRRMGRTGRPYPPIHDPAEILGDMRMFKSKAEIARLQTAGHISSEAHVNAMRVSKPGMFEYEVEAVLYHSFRVHGANRVGYNSIVASGSNACVLHYINNNRKMQDHELLLVDAGAEYDYYTADITRTYPISGTFTQEQREVYGAVLKAQKEVIKTARPGKTLLNLHELAIEVLVEELRKMKVLKGTTAQIIKKKEFRQFFPHGTSHWLGMDVHDIGKYYNGDYTSPRRLEPGMTFTVEPGLYFSPEYSQGVSRYRGIGVRIEDDVLVTSTGAKVLTSGVPKEIEEVESLCSQA
jgi:Xaa-Pro aminopeptidase